MYVRNKTISRFHERRSIVEIAETFIDRNSPNVAEKQLTTKLHDLCDTPFGRTRHISKGKKFPTEIAWVYVSGESNNTKRARSSVCQFYQPLRSFPLSPALRLFSLLFYNRFWPVTGEAAPKIAVCEKYNHDINRDGFENGKTKIRPSSSASGESKIP